MFLGTLRNHDGNANENVAWKYKFALLLLLRNYSNSLHLYNVAELSSNRIGRNGFQCKLRQRMTNLPSYTHVFHKTLNLVTSRCFFAERGGEMYQNL